MHVAYLTRVYIHQDEPWYLNILCVRVTCKVHKSRKPGHNCTQGTCHSYWKGGQIFARDHSFGISPVSIDCWKRWANTGPNSVDSSFRTLGWSPSGPKALEGFKPLGSLITPSLETAISFMKGAYLSRSGTWVYSLDTSEHSRTIQVVLINRIFLTWRTAKPAKTCQILDLRQSKLFKTYLTSCCAALLFVYAAIRGTAKWCHFMFTGKPDPCKNKS